MTCLVEDQHRIEGVGDVYQPDEVLRRLPDVLVHYVSQLGLIDLQHRVRWCTRQSQYHSGFAGLSEDGTGLPDTSPSRHLSVFDLGAISSRRAGASPSWVTYECCRLRPALVLGPC